MDNRFKVNYYLISSNTFSVIILSPEINIIVTINSLLSVKLLV